MSKRNSTLFMVLLLICSIFIFTVCTKDPKENKENNNPTIQYIQVKTEVSPLEYTNIIVRNGTLKNDTYSGTISNEIVTLIKLNDTTLTFLMPNITLGQNSLQCTIDNTTFQMVFTILQPPVFANPKDYILNYINSFENSMSLILNQMIIDSLPTDNNLNEVSQYYIQDFKDQLNTLSEDDLNQMALLIQSNQYFDVFINKRKKGDNIGSPCLISSFDCLDSYYQCELQHLYQDVKKNWTELYKCSLKIKNAYNGGLVEKLNILPSLLTYVVTYGKLYYDAYKYEKIKPLISDKSEDKPSIIQYYWNEISGQWEKIVQSFSEKKKSQIEFKKDTKYAISLYSKFRNINKNDLGNTQNIISGSVNTVSNIVSNVKFANTDFLNKKPVSVFRDFSEVNELVSSKQLKINTSYYNIQGLSNPNVTIKILGKKDSIIEVEFTTTQNTNQDFTFDIVYYNQGIASNTSHFSAKLIVPEPYTIEYVSGNNQKSNSIGQLPLPLKVLVKDINNKPLSGVKVYYNISPSCGSTAPNPAITNASGIAESVWTLNYAGDLKTQTLTAYALKSDLTTYVNGSPINFSATLNNIDLTVSPASYTMRCFVGSKQLIVETQNSWTATSDADWLTLTSASGTGNGKLTAKYTYNESSLPRTANITFYINGTEAQKVTINQEGINGLWAKLINKSFYVSTTGTTCSGCLSALNNGKSYWDVFYSNGTFKYCDNVSGTVWSSNIYTVTGIELITDSDTPTDSIIIGIDKNGNTSKLPICSFKETQYEMEFLQHWADGASSCIRRYYWWSFKK